MTDKPIHFHEPMRLTEYDYWSPGAYFITACTFDRAFLFGEVRDGVLFLNDLGRLIHETWDWLGHHYPLVSTQEHVVMPNHFHGIILIQEAGSRGSRAASTDSSEESPSLIRLVNAFKTVSAKRINSIRGTPGVPVWQRGFYDHIVRNELDLNRVREYIRANPLQWSVDEENPENLPRSVS